MPTLRNITNAFVKIEHTNKVFLADPWVTEGAFDGGWDPYPPIRNPEASLSRCDYLYISHIHEDHFDLPAISRLPRACKIVIPDIFPNYLIQQRLAALGFENIIMLEPLKPLELAPDLTVDIIPPLNSFGQELEYYREGLEAVAIDSGIMVTWEGVRIVLLNDNTPYDLTQLRSSLDHFATPDLLAMNYNGAADDYPVCYRGLSHDGKVAICDRRDGRKLEANMRLVSALKPKALLAYSSEFSVSGRQAQEFVKIRSGLYNDKTLMAQHLEKSTGLPAFALFEDDILELDTEGARKVSGQGGYPTLKERSEELCADMPGYTDRFPEVGDVAELQRDAEMAAEHMFRYMKTFRWSSEWILEVQLVGDWNPICFDLYAHEVFNGTAARDRKVLRCFTGATYFSALLHCLTHWNNAMISYNLEWERIPNEYDPFLYKSLNFLHL